MRKACAVCSPMVQGFQSLCGNIHQADLLVPPAPCNGGALLHKPCMGVGWGFEGYYEGPNSDRIQ